MKEVKINVDSDGDCDSECTFFYAGYYGDMVCCLDWMKDDKPGSNCPGQGIYLIDLIKALSPVEGDKEN